MTRVLQPCKRSGKWDSLFKTFFCKFNIADQYSRRNNAILRGLYNLPNLTGHQFIRFIADYLNFLFPSLNGEKILPIHIDDAHPLKGKGMVIIKFTNRWIKDRLFELQGDLQNTGISMEEQLTDFTKDILSSAQTEFGADNVSVHKTLVRAKVNGSKHTFRSPGELAAAVAKKNKPAPQIQSPGSASLPSVGVSPSCYVPAPASSDPVPVCQSTPVAPLSQGLASTGSNVRRNSSYMQKLNLMNKPFYPHHPKPRGFPSRNGRGGYGRGGYRNNRAPFNRRQFSQNNFSKSYDYNVNRPFQHQLINNHYNRQKFRPHPDFSTVNRFGTYYG